MRLLTVLRTSVGKKWLVGLTGFGLSFFVLTHMAGNMLILKGAESYNFYAHALITNPFLPVAEIGLLLTALVHVYFALTLARANRVSKGIKPYRTPTKDECDRASFASRSMVYTGMLTLVFLVLHLITFKYGAHYTAVYGGVEMRDLHRLVVERFKEPLYVAYYLFSLLVLLVHLGHGLSGFVQSIGLGSVRNGCLKKAGYAAALVIILGFMSQPLYIMFGGAF